jgi:hypothetical protein
MAAVDISALVALTNKRRDLLDLSYIARSREYAVRELAAAQALGIPDCLIVAFLQIDAVDVAQSRGLAAMLVPESARLRTEAAELFAVPAESLQRRLAAGTLFSAPAGTCHPWEVEWRQRALEHYACKSGSLTPSEQADIAERAQCLGYEVCVCAASTAANMLTAACMKRVPMAPQHAHRAMRAMADAAHALLEAREGHTDTVSLMSDEVNFLYALRG